MLFRTLNDKHINEECGVFGIWSRTPFALAPVVYYGLYALQHRGQESAGIVVNDDGTFRACRELGLVSEVFSHEKLEALGGGKKHALTILTPDRKTILRCTHFSCMEQKDGRGVLNGGNSGHNMALAWYPDVASAQAELKNLFDALKNGVGFYEMK